MGIERIYSTFFHNQSTLKPEQEENRLLKKINKAVVEPLLDNGLIAIRVSDEGISLARHVYQIIKLPPVETSFLRNLGVTGGVIGVGLGMREMRQGVEDFKRAAEIDDSEGSRRAKARLFSSSLVTYGSALYLAGKSADVAGIGGAAALGAVSDSFFGIGSLFGMGMSALGILRCYRFRERVDERLFDRSLHENNRLKNSLSYLLSLVSLTEEEKKAIDTSLPSNLTGEEREALRKKKQLEKTEVKVKYFKRRTSTKALSFLLKKAPELIEKLSGPDTVDLKSVREESLALIDKIKWENTRKIAMFALAFITSAIAFTALILGTFFSFGILPFVLSLVASSIYISTGLYSFIHSKFMQDFDKQGVMPVFIENPI